MLFNSTLSPRNAAGRLSLLVRKLHDALWVPSGLYLQHSLPTSVAGSSCSADVQQCFGRESPTFAEKVYSVSFFRETFADPVPQMVITPRMTGRQGPYLWTTCCNFCACVLVFWLQSLSLPRSVQVRNPRNRTPRKAHALYRLKIQQKRRFPN